MATAGFLSSCTGYFRLFYRLLQLSAPETLVRWHRAGFRGYWRWKSGSRGGRPKIESDLRAGDMGSFRWRVGKDSDNPGLFNGAAGIGLALLQLTSPKGGPDLLALADFGDPPLNGASSLG